ncbi:GLPGLI family protein [Flavobacterium sp. xlx-214]|uniref:GLPGLI family protein n=1 Tax=unclassified Flavobacterium TaxID=196869 RepID=UPI0013D3E5F0|nr:MULTISPECIES: GLPGLI family protein [unclassified Flavobacterium]MBA5791574.1 GLPGLI family protein [Flavobacterium sp. xlx-221]QMI82823.1 GLPGLI family protein [Flavobacterium sp. xlx-214]
MKANKFYLLLVLVNLISYTSISQDMDVYYTCYYDTGMPKIMPATLQIKDHISIFEEHFDESKEWNNGKDIFKNLNLSHVEYYSKKNKNKLNGFIKRDLKKKEIFLIDFIGTKDFLIKDNYIELTWNILSETKNISGFACQKAETTFRGLKWIVWFAPELHTNFGPWKLYGLPGLILEAYDNNEKYRFVAEKIIMNSTSSLYFPDKDLSVISIEKVVEGKIKRREALNAYITRGEINISDQYKVETMEPIYEWEEAVKK